MSKRHFISNLAVLAFSFVFVLLPASYVSGENVKQTKGPVVITSQMLTADNRSHTAVFERSVIARTTDMTVYADRMTVTSDKDTGDVERIDAQGNVKVVRGNRVITSREATYFAGEEKVVFTGDPRAVEDDNVITGEKMTYMMNDDRFMVEGSKAFLTSRKEKE